MNILENRGVENFLHGDGLRDPTATSMWFAGKEVLRGKLLG
eukprot:CAMPEP_0168315558 /NCGR_PEP_ID=MMETSP0210-20121227/11674_1 /TAXON_ID=40633 /ORGANISM="Condylostoma magnum, Strain COL2" /LENGTH=40 /DNA_ID= /DNA_START= /DNA_END= /DNA_ORIENTATION=